MTKKSFRGMMKTDTIDTIPLSTNNGSTGYRITKFQVISGNPVSENDRWVVKIYTIPQTITIRIRNRGVFQSVFHPY